MSRNLALRAVDGRGLPVTRSLMLAAVMLFAGMGVDPARVEAQGPGREAPATAALIALCEPGWPQWRGPRRDGIVTETGLLPTWPEEGPPLVWKATDLGRGFAPPIIAGVSIYLAGDVENECRIFALGLDGKPKWNATNGRAWTKNHPGARASCTLAGGRLYHLNAHGRLVCLDPSDGREHWHVETLERFEGKVNRWGLAESVLVDGDRVYVTPGGNRAFMAALDVRNGKTVWTSEPMPDPEAERAGYASPILVRFGERLILVTLSEKAVVGVDARTGRQLWRFLHPTPYNANCATPVLWRGHVFHTNPVGGGCVMLRMRASDDGVTVEPVWEGALDNISGGAVIVDGWVYGAAQNRGKGKKNTWMCLDAKSGAVKWKSTDLKQGSVTYADGRLYCLAEDGTMALVKASPERFEIVGRFRLAKARRKDAYAHPVILEGRMYLRYHGELWCYDVRSGRSD